MNYELNIRTFSTYVCTVWYLKKKYISIIISNIVRTYISTYLRYCTNLILYHTCLFHNIFSHCVILQQLFIRKETKVSAETMQLLKQSFFLTLLVCVASYTYSFTIHPTNTQRMSVTLKSTNSEEDSTEPQSAQVKCPNCDLCDGSGR